MTIGIDFGTSTSEVAYVDKQGKVVLVPNHLGSFITPSIVYLQPNHKPLVGLEAKEQVLVDPDNGFIEIKRLLGQDVTLTAQGKTYKPVDIAHMIIRYLVDCAQTAIGEPVTEAVITVPAYFTDAQRQEVIEAGRMAGLQVKRILNEPTAASLDYGLQHMDLCNHVLVYDLGGGTLDVTVLELFDGVVDVKASAGNNTLGGKEFDQALIDHLLSTLTKKERAALTQDPRAAMRLKMAATQCKEALSQNEHFSIELPFLYTLDDKPKSLHTQVNRQLFGSLIEESIRSTKEQIDTVLTDAQLSPNDIDQILLVGGSTRIPLVRQMLSQLFGKFPVSAVDPDLAVVRGAAIQAGVLSGVFQEDAIVLTDVCPYSLSTAVLRGKNFHGDPLEVCDVLIPRNTTLPTSISRVYATAYDNQTAVHITAYQGESERPEENTLLNKFELNGIPKGRANKESISIRFEYDLNGILNVRAEIVSTGKAVEAVAQTGRQIDLATWKTAPLAKRYRNLLNKATRMEKIHSEDTDALTEAINDLKKALILDWELAICDTYAQDLEEILEDFA